MFKLIIIDDEAFALEQFSKIINYKTYGFELAGCFVNSTEAFEYIKNNTVDLIITDIDMPNISGIDIARYCHENLPNVIIVFISAFQQFDYALEAINNNINKYLIKPITAEQFKNLLIEINIELSCEYEPLGSVQNTQLVLKQQFFSELLCGSINDKESYFSYLKELKLDNFLNNRFIISNLTINNISEFLNKKWKHGLHGMHQAISSIINLSSDDMTELFVIRYSSNFIEFVAISNNTSEKWFDSLMKAIDTVKLNLTTLLNLDFNLNQMKKYENYEALIETTAPSDIDIKIEKNEIIAQTHKYIRDNYAKYITLDDIADYVALNKMYFCSYYKKHTGETFFETLIKFRINVAKVLLSNQNTKSSLVHLSVGFSNAGYFYKKFKEYTGVTPAQYKNNALTNQ